MVGGEGERLLREGKGEKDCCAVLRAGLKDGSAGAL